MRSISVVINARLQSTRVPKKLIRPFSRSCLIEIALEKLNKMDFFDHRYLGVADHELKELAKKYENVEVLHRKLDSVKSGVNPPNVSFAHYLDIPSDYIFIFNPCQPVLSIDAIKKAYDYFQETNYSSYTSAMETRDWIFDDEGNALTNKDTSNYSTNKGRVFYKAAHSFHIVGKVFFQEHGYHWTFTKNDPHLITVPESETVDVDTELDFKLAELYYDYIYKSKNPLA
jgi:CMP-N-acetylneuraminic acid synthetase